MKALHVLEAVLQEEKKWIRCRNGFISYEPRGYGGGYYVTASGQKAMTVRSEELHSILRDLQQRLGGALNRL